MRDSAVWMYRPTAVEQWLLEYINQTQAALQYTYTRDVILTDLLCFKLSYMSIFQTENLKGFDVSWFSF